MLAYVCITTAYSIILHLFWFISGVGFKAHLNAAKEIVSENAHRILDAVLKALSVVQQNINQIHNQADIDHIDTSHLQTGDSNSITHSTPSNVDNHHIVSQIGSFGANLTSHSKDIAAAHSVTSGVYAISWLHLMFNSAVFIAVFALLCFQLYLLFKNVTSLEYRNVVFRENTPFKKSRQHIFKGEFRIFLFCFEVA